MAWWEAVLDVLAGAAVLAALSLVGLFVRRRLLSRQGGTFECSVRMNPPMRSASPLVSSRGWRLGLGRYDGDNLEWFRVFSFSPRPKYTFDRSLSVDRYRTPQGPEAFSLYSGHKVVAVNLHGGGRIELAMSERALTGFLAWAEASPPGQGRLLS